MPFDLTSKLWPNKDDHFFRDRVLRPIRQNGPHCVAAVLAILASAEPELFQHAINTQDPFSWSDAIARWNMKLCYCPTDIRKLCFYMAELIEMDDLFTLSYYTTQDKDIILRDPDDRGWLCGSHIVVLYRDKILDPATGTVVNALEHKCNCYHTKRIFRVVPRDYVRGL